MKNRIQGLVLGVLCSMCFLSGCQKEDPKETFAVVDKMRTQVKNEGIFYINGYTEQMQFYDFNLAQSLPICDRPNCTHQSAGCNAYFSQGYMSGMGCYRDKLYFYDNMSPGLPFYQCDKNGSNRRELAKLNENGEYGNLMVELPLFFAEDKAVFGMTFLRFLAEPVTKEDGTVIHQEMYWMLGTVHLENGAFEIVKEPEKLGDSQWIEIGGYSDGTVFYTIAGGDASENRRYDIRSGEDTPAFAPDDGEIRFLGMAYGPKKAVYLKEEGDVCEVLAMDVATGDTEAVFCKTAEPGKVLFMRLAGETLYYCISKKGEGTKAGEAFGAYSLLDREEKELTKDEFWYAPFTAETKDWYVGITEDGMVCIPKEAYHKQDWDRVQVVGSF